MAVTRRGFIESILGLVVTSAAGPLLGKDLPSVKKTESSSPKYPPEYDILFKAYFPTLKLNEGEKFHFYRCKNKKLTVGYGTNIESNGSLLDGVKVFFKGKCLSDKAKDTFLKTYTSKSDKALSDYTILQSDAEEMAKKFTYKTIDNLVNVFRNLKTKKSIFFDLPIPMQILALDVNYNIGNTGFSKFKRFKSALLARDYIKATKESVVYVGNNKTNKGRERRKQRLLRITQIVQKHLSQPLEMIQKLVCDDYKKVTPRMIQLLAGKTDRICENSIVLGEFKRTKLNESICSLNKKNLRKV